MLIFTFFIWNKTWCTFLLGNDWSTYIIVHYENVPNQQSWNVDPDYSCWSIYVFVLSDPTNHIKLSASLSSPRFIMPCTVNSSYKRINTDACDGEINVCGWIWRIWSVITSPPEGVARYCFHPVCVCVCLSVCVCICVSGQYFGILFLGY